MTLNANTIRELLDASTPGPWEYKLEDGHIMSDLVEVLNGWIQTEDGETVLGTGLEINDEQELRNLALAARAPELAAEVLRLHEALSAWIEDERAAETAIHSAYGLRNITTTHTTIINRIHNILNGDI